jgi:TonB family protein
LRESTEKEAPLKTKIFVISLGLTIGSLICVQRLFAGDDIAIQLRLYQGFREAEPRQSDVVSAYSLEKIFSGNIFSEAEMSKEVKTLAKVFNLQKVKILMNASLVLKVEKGEKTAEVFVLNGRKLVLLLTKVAREKDMFAVEVKEKEDDAKPLLGTDIVVPEGKTATLGFADSEEKIFFLTLHRGPDQQSTDKDVQRLPKEGKGPKLIKKVSPVYPPEARQAGVEGTVILEATIDIQGKVTNVRVLKGENDLLNKAAIEAIKQWQYEPVIVEGKPMQFVFTVTVRFALNDKSNGQSWP